MNKSWKTLDDMTQFYQAFPHEQGVFSWSVLWESADVCVCVCVCFVTLLHSLLAKFVCFS